MGSGIRVAAMLIVSWTEGANVMSVPCRCPPNADHDTRLIVLTGGPGAGKTAVLEALRTHVCEHVAVLPEAAGIVFGGGFPRGPSLIERRAAQVAIFHVQKQLERVAVSGRRVAIALCDRGMIDGLAYWPGDTREFWEEVGSSRLAALARYTAVIHLRTPPIANGYDHSNPLRIETAEQARSMDERILEAWRGHPRCRVIESTASFADKVHEALTQIRLYLPVCCAGHIDATLRDVARRAS